MKTKIFKTIIFALFTYSVSFALVAEGQAAQTEDLGPEVRILQDKNANIEEFRSNGKVYMIKIKPKKGPAYYLVDADGDGDFDTRRNDLQPNLLIPSWVLFSW
jgi:hypothetical protein